MQLVLPLVIAVVFASSTTLGQVRDIDPVPQPKSMAVKDAVSRAERAEKDARAEFSRAMIAIKQAQLTAIKEAQRAAMVSGNLEEANAIAPLIQQTQIELDAYSGKAIHGKVAARGAFQTIAILPAGSYAVAAVGRWRSGPSGLITADGHAGKKSTGYTIGALVARVNGKLVEVKTKGRLVLDFDGPVEMRMWDSEAAEHQADNAGEVLVTITRE